MNHSSKEKNSKRGYTMEEFYYRLNAMLAKYGISALVNGKDLHETVKQRTYKVKMITPQLHQE